MVDYKTEIKEKLKSANFQLEELKRLFQSLNANDRVAKTMNDIENTIKNSQTYLNNDQLWDLNSFRFDNNLVSLVDSIQYNDYGILWDDTMKSKKTANCEGILKIVSALNALTLAAKKENGI